MAPADADSLRGWFYRAVASKGDASVLETSDCGADRWFANVQRGELGAAERVTGLRFDLVVLHHSLGGCANLAAALGCAARLLHAGGIVVVAGENRLRRSQNSTAMPLATPWGYRVALKRAGFDEVEVLAAHPGGAAPIHVVRVERASARAFYGATLRARGLGALSLRRLVLAMLIHSGAYAYLQSHYLAVGRRC